MAVCESGRLPRSEHPRWRVTILNPACPSRKGSYRAKYTWPALRNGMTVAEWDAAARAVDERGEKSEGVPSVYPCECVKSGHIRLDPA